MAVSETDIGTKLAGWLGLLHPPFHTVGIFPFILGTVLAWRLDTRFNITALILSTLGVVLVMLATYHAEEYFSSEDDEHSKRLFRHRLVGGAGAIRGETRSGSLALLISVI